MMRFDKLVRDRIPEIIEADGKRCETSVLNDEEFDQRLAQKLEEELAEYQKTGDIAELADLVEVIQTLAERQGVAWTEFEAIRDNKRIERGAFTRRLLLRAIHSER